MNHQKITILTLFTLAALISGCGTEEKADTEYFPLATGNTWEYLETYDSATHDPETTRHEVIGFETVTDFDGNEVEVWVVHNSPNVTTDEQRVYWILDDGVTVRRIRQTVDSDGDGEINKQQDYVPGVTKLDRSHLATDNSWNDDIMRHTSYPADPTADQESKQLLYEWTVVSMRETVTVPAGTFENCIKITRETTSQGAEETKHYWFAPDVGKVKEQTVEDNKVEELSSYQINVQD